MMCHIEISMFFEYNVNNKFSYVGDSEIVF